MLLICALLRTIRNEFGGDELIIPSNAHSLKLRFLMRIWTAKHPQQRSCVRIKGEQSWHPRWKHNGAPAFRLDGASISYIEKGLEIFIGECAAR